MVAKKKRGNSPFKGKVVSNLDSKGKKGSNYLNAPDDVPFLSPNKEEQETLWLDFLPYEVKRKNHPDRDDKLKTAQPGDLWWKFPIRVHRNVGANKQALICPRTVGQRCAICDHRDHLFETEGKGKKTNDLRPSFRVLYIVVPRGSDRFKEVPHIFEIAFNNFGALLKKTLKEETEYEAFMDPDEGYLMKASFDSNSFDGNKYAEAFKIVFHEREEEITDKELEKAPNLDDVVEIPTAEEVYRIFWEEEPDDGTEEDDEPEEEDTPEPPRRKGKFKKDTSSDAPAKEIPEEDAPEEEEKSPKPSKKSRKSRAKGKQETKSSGEECPFGLEFGEDWDKDEYREEYCNKCPQETWDACAEKNEELYG